VVGNLGEKRIWNKITPYFQAAAAKKRLDGICIGLIVWRAQGMSVVVFNELTLRETFGVEVVNVDLTRYARTIEAIPPEKTDSTWNEMRSGFDISEINKRVVPGLWPI
jgi:L-fucose isomerase-like protein